MDTPSRTPIDPRLEHGLRLLRQRIRRLLGTRGALITAVTALTILLALMALDYALAPLPALVRWLCPVAWLAGVATAAWVSWWVPLHQRLDSVRIARWLETRHPDLDERLSTVLEVSGSQDGGMSSQLIAQLAGEASAHLDHINPRTEVSTRLTLQWLWPAAALLLAWGLLFGLWPSPTAHYVARALLPTSHLGNAAGRITVTPGSVELIANDALEIFARHPADPHQALELVLHLTDGTPTVMAMTARDGGAFYQLGRADRNLEYEVRAGRNISDRFKVTVWPQPCLSDPRVRLEYPAYTGWPPREQALGDGIAAIAGTQVEVRAQLNTPVAEAHLEIDDQAAGTSTLEHAANVGHLTSRWTLEHPGHSNGRVVLKHRIKREFEAARFRIESRPDTPPEVKWLGALPQDLRLQPADLLERDYQVSDDVGLSAAQVEVQTEQGATALLATPSPLGNQRAETPLWTGHLQQAIGVLASRWPQAHVFQLRLRVEDSRPAELGGPNVGTSEWLTLHLDTGAPSLARQELAAAQSDARETIEQACQNVQRARETIDRRRQDLQREKIPEDARKELGQAGEQLAATHDQLEQLAARMQDSIEAALASEVHQASATLAQALQELENAPLQDTAPQRAQSAAAARQKAAKAEHQLEKIRDEIQRQDAQIQDYTKLKELEQQQGELARQAEQADASKGPSQPWQPQQANVAEALRKDAQQQPMAQAASLAQQAQHAQQLATEAREQAATQESLKQAATAQTSPAEPSNAAAKEAAELASKIRDTPQVNGPSGPMQQAAQTAQQAAQQAQQAAQAGTQGKRGDASNDHAQASQQLQQTAARLDQAAAEFTQQAAQAAARQAGDNQAPVPGEALAEAFQQAGQAAKAKPPASAASHARAAAEALSQAAAGTLRAMQNPAPSRQPGHPAATAQGAPPSTQPSESPLRMPTASPGVPPELAKLGISAADWEKIKSALKSDVGGSGAIAMPEEYRDLVRHYFEEISKGSN